MGNNASKTNAESLQNAFMKRMHDIISKKNKEKLEKLSEKFKQEQIKYELLINNKEYQVLEKQKIVKKCPKCGSPSRIINTPNVKNKFISLSDTLLYLQFKKLSRLFCMLHFNSIHNNYRDVAIFFSLRNENCIICYIEKLEYELRILRAVK